MTMLKAEALVELDKVTQERDALAVDRDSLLKGQAEFIDGLVDVAGAAAYEEELCHVLEKTLKKVGVTPPNYVVKVQRTTTDTYKVTGFDYYRMGLHLEKNRTVSHLKDALEYTEYVDTHKIKPKTTEAAPVVLVERVG